ncbi:hypothetical protein FKM82_026248 [Ascaphus truei]
MNISTSNLFYLVVLFFHAFISCMMFFCLHFCYLFVKKPFVVFRTLGRDDIQTAAFIPLSCYISECVGVLLRRYLFACLSLCRKAHAVLYNDLIYGFVCFLYVLYG